jgi:hypothetical protein
MGTSKRYTPSLSTRNDLVSEITPLVFLSGVDNHPHGPFIPAPWLPVAFQDTDSKDWFVMSSGKVVCLTTPREEGWVVPAGVKTTYAGADGSTALTYTSDDFDNKTMNLTTGEAYAVDGTTSYTVAQVRTALRSRGLIGASDALPTYVSDPVGCVLTDVWAWAGRGATTSWNPAHLKFQNFQKQKGVQFTSRSQMVVPQVPIEESAVVVPGSLTGTPAFGDTTLASAADAKTLERYEDITNLNFIAWFLHDGPIAKSTDRTLVEGSASDFLVTDKSPEQSSLATFATSQAAITSAVNRLTTAGDFAIDYDFGVVFLYVSGGASVPANASGETITYFSYDASPAAVERYVAAVGDLRPGDWLKVDVNSNFQLWVQGADDPEERIARVVALDRQPKDFLEFVRTGWEGADFGAKQQMSGSASKGFSSQITYSNAADTLVQLVLNVR